jgi:hypothetical protein
MSAAKFGARPSEMVGLRDPVLALDFDLAATARLLAAERAAAHAEPASGSEPPDEGSYSAPAPPRAREEHW